MVDRFIVHLIEQGRARYGVGLTTPLTLLIDRGGTVFRNGKKKQEKLDMGVIPNLVILLRNLYTTLSVSFFLNNSFQNFTF